MGLRPEAVLAALTSLLTRLCEHDQTWLAAETKLDAIPGIDSLRLLQAVAHLEEEFSVEIDVRALEDLSQVQDILDAIVNARPVDAACPRDPA